MKLSFTAPCSIKAEGQGGLEKGTIVMQPAYSGGLLMLNGWDYPCVVDVASIRAAAPLIPCRVGHGQLETDVLGQIEVSVASGNVNAAGRVTNRESPGPRAVLSMAAAGHQFQASIGGEPARKDFIPPGREVDINGQTFSGPIYACYDTTLGEISVVSLGADTSTSTTIAAQRSQIMADEKKPDFSEFCKAAGFDPGTMDDKQKASMADIHAKLCAGDEPPPEAKKDDEKKAEEEKKAEAARRQASIQASGITPPASVAAEYAKQYRRIGEIQAACKDHADICAAALDGKWDDTRIKNEIELKQLRAGRAENRAPAAHIAGRGVDVGKSIEATWMLAGHVNEDRLAKEYGDQNVSWARSRMRGMGIRALFAHAARLQGVELPEYHGSWQEYIHPVLALWNRSDAFSIQADGGASPVSLPGILSNVAHKLLLEGYNYIEQTWKVISKQGTLQDFKPHNRFRLTNDMKFKPLNTSGELQHGKLGEQAYIIQGDTEGIMFNLDRKLIVNDDMSAFSEIPKQVGRGAGLAINDAFWTLFLSNPVISTKFNSPEGLVAGTAAFWSSANNNQCTGTAGTSAQGLGTTSILSVAGLATGYTAVLRQTDPAGYVLGQEPKILLVPASLRYTAESLMISRILVSQLAPAGGSLQPSENPLAGKFQVAASAYLDNALYTNASTTAWYLLLDPNAGYDVIEAAFLNGMQTPIVERAEANFENLGIRFRSWTDFGLAMKEPRGGMMMTGAA